MPQIEFGLSKIWQKLIAGICLYLAVKPICNALLLGGSILPLGFAVVSLILLWSGVKGSNLVIGILLMLVACANFPTNMKSGMYFYAAEGIIDMLCAVLLAFHPDIRVHCKLT